MICENLAKKCRIDSYAESIRTHLDDGDLKIYLQSLLLRSEIIKLDISEIYAALEEVLEENYENYIALRN